MSHHRISALVLAVAATFATGLPAIANHGPAHAVKLAPLVADGIFGGRTTTAVKNFQAAKGMKVDGLAGPATLKALGLSATRTLQAGSKGNDVKALQKALSGWEMKPIAKPVAKPTPAATPMPLWTPAPTPEPTMMPTPEPTMMPTPEPWSPAPTVEPTMEPTTWRPTVQLWAGDWMLPKTAGQYDYDFGFTKPAWLGGAAVWMDAWGVAGAYTTVPDLYVGATKALGGGGMYDGQVKWRCDGDMHHVGIGYRGLGPSTGFPAQSFGTLSYGLTLPLGTDMLKLKLNALGASNFGPGWMADAKGSLALGLGPVVLEAGYRGLWLNGFNSVSTTVYTHAPFAQVGLEF